MEYQVRRYLIKPDKLDPFIDAWKNSVVPLRQRFGFQILCAWSLPNTDEFIWILGHEGPEGFAAADAAYYASSDRQGLSPNPSDFIETALEEDAHRVI